MITEIGITAGEIWQYLEKHNETTLERLTAAIKKDREIVLMSLGWLAREGHILVNKEGSVVNIVFTKKAE